MNRVLTINEMAGVSASGKFANFCKGFAAAEVIYGVGILANWWNPVGWGAGATALTINAACIFS